ncbi:unnamed protein product [Urochloa decumbens]|uniref:Sacsin/Nov domain-containing protein n=1 Tax=Urochloa decumbens TaxID=240449 RepID=A0ABC8VJT1_9POAL
MGSTSASSAAAMAEARAHVERIRRERFFIGREERNPLAEDIHQAVTYLSEELYSKDVHFLMELIQNAEDNEYPLDVSPELEFVMTKKDITATGAESTLLLFNNERGFSAANIESICRIGRSTKKGNRHLGYIGEKGIGFKSVFLVSSQPHIFSNGYQIKFNEKPSADCDIGYIVPEWVDGKPSIDDITTLYGHSRTLPTTIIILPLKTDKILAVKKELSSTHPEILLFLSKIRQLSVREMNDDPKASKISQISISSEVDYRMRKDIDAESYTLHLAMQENSKGQNEECTYYMWKQKFAVKPECKIQKRVEVDEWVVTLAFPQGQRLSKGAQSPGVYAFLPTEMVTNFPFIIQSDFVLASSRESILFDSQWNRGILDCVPSAFVNAFGTILKSSSDAPLFALPPIFRFLPIQASSISLFDAIRQSIKTKVKAEDIMPCESCITGKFFCNPTEVSRLDTAFWRILNIAQKQGINMQNLSSYGTFVLSTYLDNQEEIKWYERAKTKDLLHTPFDLANFMHRDRWLHTSVGFRSPKETIIFSSAWEPVAAVSSLPFVDDNDTKYGLGEAIYCYQNELRAFGSKVGLEQGAAFVISGLNIPHDAADVTPEAVISLLTCIRSWRKNGSALPESFMNAINVKWVKTTAGYKHPNECILFETECSSHVHRDDGPFIDEIFYGHELVSYESELQAIGVIVNARAGCALMAHHLRGLSNGDKISRIYSYLETFCWKPWYTSDDWIWIPHEADEGQWVNPDSCVLYDTNSLFGSQLHVLEKWYNRKLLRYFNTTFGVKRHPTVSDYCKLWSMWQDSNSALAQKDCAAFWEFFGKNWRTDIEKFIAGCITKVPVCSGDQILLLEKQDVFIPDDLILEDLFKKQAQQPLFVWYPSASLPCLSPAKLNDIYSGIGVQKISKAVARDESEHMKIEHVTIVHKGTMIKPGLLRIVLAFLADPILDISAKKRHEMVSGLTNVVVYETSMPLTVSYQVGLSSGRSMVVTSARFFCWERENSSLFVTKTEASGSVINAIKLERAACFAEEISKGLLFENTDQVPALAELVRTGFLLDFDVPAIDILLKLKNIRLFEEDEQFLLPYADTLRVPQSFFLVKNHLFSLVRRCIQRVSFHLRRAQETKDAFN